MKFTFIGTVLGCDNYGATEGQFSFIIGHIKDMGWVASYKDRFYQGGQSSHFILNEGKRSIDNPFKTRDQAEAACRRKMKELRLS